MASNSTRDELIPGTGVTSRRIEAFGRTVTATASHLIMPTAEVTSSSYRAAMGELHRELRRPQLQRGVLGMVTRASPSETLRARLSRTEIEHRALTSIPDELLRDVPKEDHAYSLFEGFRASLPEETEEKEHRKRHRRRASRGSAKLLEDGTAEDGGAPALAKLRRERDRAAHRLEMMGVRKNMCSAEILELDKKVANLGRMRKIVLDRLSDLEEDEVKGEAELQELDLKVEEMQELLAEEAEVVAGLEPATPSVGTEEEASTADGEEEEGMVTPTGSPTFMSQSIYEKLPSPKSVKRPKFTRRRSAAVRHGHFEPGTNLQVIPAHNDMVTALDFDAPFCTMVTAALDDTVRVWDLNRGRCLGLLEGHRASVRCLQVDENLVATGSIDASVRLWDLSQANYPTPPVSTSIHQTYEDDDDASSQPDDSPTTTPHQASAASMANTPVFSLSAHVAEITALHFHKDTLVSGSADKTLRQWDLVKGRCVQTLDVLWAAAQASTASSAPSNLTASARGGANGMSQAPEWSTASMLASRLPDPEADFVGALQCFDAALACGTADGMVRLWDLRSGQVHRSLVGHTAPVSALQFDDARLVTASLDRSIRIWDLRTGAIFDAYAYDQPVTSMMFDARRIVAAAGEQVVKVYDKLDGQHWDCGTTDEEESPGGGDESAPRPRSVVERVRIKDGFMVEGRRNGEVGVWTC